MHFPEVIVLVGPAGIRTRSPDHRPPETVVLPSQTEQIACVYGVHVGIGIAPTFPGCHIGTRQMHIRFPSFRIDISTGGGGGGGGGTGVVVDVVVAHGDASSSPAEVGIDHDHDVFFVVSRYDLGGYPPATLQSRDVPAAAASV